MRSSDNGPWLIYQDVIVRAVAGRPAQGANLHNATALRGICDTLAENEDALTILRQRGYGDSGMSLADVVRSLPEVTK